MALSQRGIWLSGEDWEAAAAAAAAAAEAAAANTLGYNLDWSVLIEECTEYTGPNKK